MADSLESVFERINNAPRWEKAWWAAKRRTKVAVRSPQTAASAIRRARQRAARGWDDRAIWGLDRHIGRTLGAQLVEMARISHSWPAPYPGDFDGWVHDLRWAGEALLAYGAHDDLSEGEKTSADAKAALLWVSDNLGALWD